tara:strand:- start:516 stop:665 length:150 start_codon:yes stop_codon:yes gene_type:complete
MRDSIFNEAIAGWLRVIMAYMDEGDMEKARASIERLHSEFMQDSKRWEE